MSASYTFPAPPERVWALLTDPETVAACLPGCERLEPLGDDRYRVALALTIAAVGGQYAGTVAMLDQDRPRSYRLVMEGRGRLGFVNGEATVELTGQERSTTVRVNGRGDVGGAIAAVGQRMLGAASKMMMDRFFGCLQQKASAISA